MLTTRTSAKVIMSLTQSWRYLLFLSLLPYLLSLLFFMLYSSPFYSKLNIIIASLLFLFTQYSLFRLWLDNHFFQALYEEQDDVSFDESLSVLFPQKKKKQSMRARWQGTKRLFSLALVGVITQWTAFLMSLFI